MGDEEQLRVLIVEDEPLGAARITDLLSDEDDVTICGIAEDCPSAVAAIREEQPDLVFLDIQIPQGSGLDVVREIGPEAMPTTIFVTAYDQYATEAFRLAAVDYLLKPYSDERFEEAFQRARRRLRLEGLEKMRNGLGTLIESEDRTASTPGAGRVRFPDRITIQSRGRMRVVMVRDIDYVTASGVYAELHVGDRQHLLRESMTALEEQLDPEVFFRIHRSAIVRIDQIEMLLRSGGGSYEVQLKDGTKLRVGRSRRAELEEKLGG